jgi:hypothetical protein
MALKFNATTQFAASANAERADDGSLRLSPDAAMRANRSSTVASMTRARQRTSISCATTSLSCNLGKITFNRSRESSAVTTALCAASHVGCGDEVDARVAEELERRRGTRIAEHLKLVLSIIDRQGP